MIAELPRELFRHQCEVRFLLNLRAKNDGSHTAYAKAIAAKRSLAASARVVDDATDQWKKGNRGKSGDWR